MLSSVAVSTEGEKQAMMQKKARFENHHIYLALLFDPVFLYTRKTSFPETLQFVIFSLTSKLRFDNTELVVTPFKKATVFFSLPRP